MTAKRFKVVQCNHCHTLTYKRLTYKTIRCPICNRKITGEPVKLFQSAQEAIAFIKQEKLAKAPERGSWFETFH